MYRATTRNPHGYAVITNPEARTQEFDTLSCAHCGCHWQVIPGSGIKRGFCMNCMQVTCGSPSCHACLPQEKWLDRVEKGIIIP
jgi:hypothetical protein